MIASEYAHEVIAKLMLDLGTNVHASLRGRSQPIYKAAYKGHEKVVQVLLARGAKQIKGEYGTPLHEAAGRGFVKAVQVLIDHDADIDALWPAPIAMAAASGNLHMVQFLIEKGANLGLDRSGQQALCNAAHGGHESIVRLLVECGVDVDGTQEHSPLLYAFLDRQDQAAKALVELGAKRKDPLESEFVKR